MFEALQTYLSRHGERLKEKYEPEGEPGCALPGAKSEKYKSRSEAWQAGELQPVLLFSTNSVKWSSRSAQQMVVTEKALAHDDKYHEQHRQDYQDKQQRWRSQQERTQQDSGGNAHDRSERMKLCSNTCKMRMVNSTIPIAIEKDAMKKIRLKNDAEAIIGRNVNS